MVFAFFIRLTACLVAVVLLILAAESDVSFIRSKANEARHADKSCVWDCKVVGSKFGLQMKTLISEFRLITVKLNYEHEEDKECLNPKINRTPPLNPQKFGRGSLATFQVTAGKT